MNIKRKEDIELKKTIKESEIEMIGDYSSDSEIIIKDLINIKYLPKNKTPINNLFLVVPLFTPCPKNIKIENKHRRIKIEDEFGYSLAIEGPRLNMSIDFPIWSNIIKLVTEKESNVISMSYIEFAKILNYNRKDLGEKLKNRIKESLIRLKGQVIITETEDDDNVLGLLIRGTIKKKIKEVDIVVDPKVIELYKTDRFKLIDLEYYQTLQNEVTKALFLYYENHGKIVYPIKIDQIKKRLNLITKNEKEINRQIKQSHENLIEKKYLNSFEYFKNAKDEKCIKVKKQKK